MKTRIIKRKGTLLSSVAMLSTAMLLTACGGDGGDSPVDDGGANPGESGAQALLYAYPDNGQGEVSTAAPVVLRFSSAVNLGEAQNSITVYEGDAQSGTVVAVTPESVAGEPNNVLLQPDEDLKPNQIYTVVIEDLRLRKGTAKDQTLTFTTRPLHEGPKSLVVKEDTFEVSRRMPDGSAMEPVMDFSSFRFQFTQPIDRATANYGEDPASTGPGGGTIPADSVVLRDSSGAPVPATLLIDGAYMTLDPEPEYLNTGETYTLDITADLASTYGEAFGAESYTFTPKDSSPGREPAILVQKLTQGTTSRLTGKPVNEVPVNGTLLGENDNITQASAEVVRAELADVTTYTDVTPIRLPKGTVLNGAEINPILIGGEVPAGFGSGDVTMTVLSDASGYLVPNPYAGNNPDALRIVHLLMDVGIATSEARANGAFTQDLLHIELVGLAEVDPTAGVLNLDAVSVVEPDILGQEYGYGMLSFQLQSYKDQNNLPKLVDDVTPPVLQSWVPGDNVSLFEPKSPIIINYNEVIRRFENSADAVALYKNGVLQAVNVTVDGSAIVIQPQEPLTHSSENDPIEYEVQINEPVMDLSRNAVTDSFQGAFEPPLKVEERNNITNGGPENYEPTVRRSPFVLSAYPGYPCFLEASSRNIAENEAGRCQGGFPGYQSGTQYDNKPADDLLPIMEMPANRPIVINFSKEIDKESVVLTQTFIVERLSEQGNVLGEVDGDVNVLSKSVRFYPDEPWVQGQLYQYTLASNDDMNSSVALCDGTDAICDVTGLPLQTQVLGTTDIVPVEPPDPTAIFPPERETRVLKNPPLADGGGPSLVQYFRGGKETTNVLQSLSNLPVADVNANLIHDANINVDEPFPPGLFGDPLGLLYSYRVEEPGPSSQPDPYADPALDPNGVLPPPNSAKVLSTNVRGLPPGENPVVNGGNVGCGYSQFVPYDPSMPFFTYGIPLECPQDKFTYIIGALNAEVTNDYDPEKGLKVIIWPSRIAATGIYVRARFQNVPNVISSNSGPQYLRMRYAKDQAGNRTQPIIGWIKNEGGSPKLGASVDLYVDAPAMKDGLIFNTPTHNLVSYPISMDLSGDIRFLADGRMVIEQYNMNNVDLNVRIQVPDGSWAGFLDLRIPSHGSRLQYVSETIK